MRYPKLRQSTIAKREESIKNGLIDRLQDQPGDYYHRVCRYCGAPVEGLIVKGKGRKTGKEFVRCTGPKRHYLHTGDWEAHRTED